MLKFRLFSYPSVETCVLGAQKNASHRDGSFKYLQYMFWLRNKKNSFQLRPFIRGGGGGGLIIILNEK